MKLTHWVFNGCLVLPFNVVAHLPSPRSGPLIQSEKREDSFPQQTSSNQRRGKTHFPSRLQGPLVCLCRGQRWQACLSHSTLKLPFFTVSPAFPYVSSGTCRSVVLGEKVGEVRQEEGAINLRNNPYVNTERCMNQGCM